MTDVKELAVQRMQSILFELVNILLGFWGQIYYTDFHKGLA